MNIRNIILPLLAICTSLIPIWNCSATGKAVNHFSQNSTSESFPDKPIQVNDVCVILGNPQEFDGKLVKLRSTIYRMGTVISIGDTRCIQRHSVIDVEFSSSFQSQVCNPSDFPAGLCSLTKGISDDSDGIEITAYISGQVYPVVAKSGFSVDGLRLRFVVHEIDNIESIIPIKQESIN